MSKIPYLKKDDKGIISLIVGGKAYFGLAGELHNSNSSDAEHLKQIWAHIHKLNIDTVFAPVYWEMLEPVEGEFDFSQLDTLISQAREESIRLIILWFGLWKNGQSFYVPEWVKSDYKRFWRIESSREVPINTISPFCKQAVQADANAFTELMKRIKHLDEQNQTVLMVQVENEIGVLGAERDFSAEAEVYFDAQVPQELAEVLKIDSLSWNAAFKEDANEFFMAYYYAKAIEKITVAGKSVYNLPMFVNAWLEQFPKRPGKYPSGGPVAKVMPIWKTGAPSIDIFAPDIYLPNIAEICEEYTQYENPLLIPEARRDPVTASNLFYAFGKYNAICFSPFAVDRFYDNADDTTQASEALLQQLNILKKAFSCVGTADYLSASYGLMKSIKELYLSVRGTGVLHPFIMNNPNEQGVILALENCDLQIAYRPIDDTKPGSAGFVIEQNDHSFWIIGTRIFFTVLPKKGGNENISLVKMEEGIFVNSVWKKGRILNGDELAATQLGDMAEAKRISYHIYK